MSRTKSPSTGTPYGLARVLGAWGVPRSTYYWQRTRRHNPLEARKRRPKTAFSDKGTDRTAPAGDRGLAVYRRRPS